MSLETVVEDIREEARKTAEQIRKEAEQEAEEIINEAEQEAEQIREESKQDAEEQIEQERKQARSNAQLKARQQRLGARRDLLSEAHEEVGTALTELSEDKRRALTEALLDAARQEFGTEELVVYGRDDDQRLIEDLLSPSEQFGGTRDCLGGVVVEGPDGRVRVNNTFDSILEEVWEQNLKEISSQLFEDTDLQMEQ